MEKLAGLPGALVFTGAMALQSQAGCALPELPPMAVDVGIAKKEIYKRQEKCTEGGREARAIMRDGSRSTRAHYYAAQADERFRRTFRGLENGVWDNKTFKEAEDALELARHAK